MERAAHRSPARTSSSSSRPATPPATAGSARTRDDTSTRSRCRLRRARSRSRRPPAGRPSQWYNGSRHRHRGQPRSGAVTVSVDGGPFSAPDRRRSPSQVTACTRSTPAPPTGRGDGGLPDRQHTAHGRLLQLSITSRPTERRRCPANFTCVDSVSGVNTCTCLDDGGSTEARQPRAARDRPVTVSADARDNVGNTGSESIRVSRSTSPTHCPTEPPPGIVHGLQLTAAPEACRRRHRLDPACASSRRDLWTRQAASSAATAPRRASTHSPRRRPTMPDERRPRRFTYTIVASPLDGKLLLSPPFPASGCSTRATAAATEASSGSVGPYDDQPARSPDGQKRDLLAPLHAARHLTALGDERRRQRGQATDHDHWVTRATRAGRRTAPRRLPIDPPQLEGLRHLDRQLERQPRRP